MACGCGKKNVVPRRVNLRPVVGPTPIQGGTAAAVAPATVRALGMQASVTLTESRRLDEQRQRLERLRRDAIKRRLSK